MSDPGTSIANANAVPFPSEYHICDRTGFRVPAGELVKEWTGAMVRRQSWESRHPQDFVRARPEHHKGSPRPELRDRYLDSDEQVNSDGQVVPFPPVVVPPLLEYFMLIESGDGLLTEDSLSLLLESAP